MKIFPQRLLQVYHREFHGIRLRNLDVVTWGLKKGTCDKTKWMVPEKRIARNPEIITQSGFCLQGLILSSLHK
jgi:hypothetical protein